jgi:hypothetical protein
MSVLPGEQFPPVYHANHKIGTLILPDTVALDPTGADYARRFGCTSNLRVFEGGGGPRKLRAAFLDNNDDFQEWIVFGQEFEGPEGKERAIRENGRPIIRYIMLCACY